MDTVRSVEMDLLCSLAFNLDVDVPYMDLTRSFRTAGLLQCAAEHSELLGDHSKTQGGVNLAEGAAVPSPTSVPSAAADSTTNVAQAAAAVVESQRSNAEGLEEKVRARLMQMALNFVKDR
jgi:hypothetical protein